MSQDSQDIPIRSYAAHDSVIAEEDHYITLGLNLHQPPRTTRTARIRQIPQVRALAGAAPAVGAFVGLAEGLDALDRHTGIPTLLLGVVAVAYVIGAVIGVATFAFATTVELTDESDSVWKNFRTEADRVRRHVAGLSEATAIGRELDLRAREVFDLLKAATDDELELRAALDLKSGTFQYCRAWRRHLSGQLRGERLAWALRVDDRRYDALTAALEITGQVREMADAAEDRKLARAHYLEVVEAEKVTVDLDSLRDYTTALAGDAERLRELAHAR